ncbi:MAG: hypothetical protein IPI77_08235 [Saprospiraceae bacterium]|nr:hypothetical protein [Saprospiraceae bacterium]
MYTGPALQVYVMKWIVPAYQKIDTASASAGAAVNNAAAGQILVFIDFSTGCWLNCFKPYL